jgi:hypothetical protein
MAKAHHRAGLFFASTESMVVWASWSTRWQLNANLVIAETVRSSLNCMIPGVRLRAVTQPLETVSKGCYTTWKTRPRHTRCANLLIPYYSSTYELSVGIAYWDSRPPVGKSHLFRRGGTWFVRVAIPRHLQDTLRYPPHSSIPAHLLPGRSQQAEARRHCRDTHAGSRGQTGQRQDIQHASGQAAGRSAGAAACPQDAVVVAG